MRYKPVNSELTDIVMGMFYGTYYYQLLYSTVQCTPRKANDVFLCSLSSYKQGFFVVSKDHEISLGIFIKKSFQMVTE